MIQRDREGESTWGRTDTDAGAAAASSRRSYLAQGFFGFGGGHSGGEMGNVRTRGMGFLGVRASGREWFHVPWVHRLALWTRDVRERARTSLSSLCFWIRLGAVGDCERG